MLMPNQIATVKVVGKTLKYYRDLGYNVNMFDIIQVPVEHLTDGSHIHVQIQCDICGKTYDKAYKSYLNQHTYGIDTCNKCKTIKLRQTCLNLYGVENPMQDKNIQDKYKQSLIKQYGVENISQAYNVKEKKKKTFIERYGVDNPTKDKDIKEKQLKSLYEHYGVTNPLKSAVIKKKVQETNLLRYGYKVAIQNPTIKEKALKTLYNNNMVPTSKQQLEIYDMVKQHYNNVQLNAPEGTFSLDILLIRNNIKIDIEYDGGYWHQDQQKDIKRDKVLQSRGFKIIRIRSSHMLPTYDELLSAIEYLLTTDHVYKEIILSDWNLEQYKINKEQEVSA